MSSFEDVDSDGDELLDWLWDLPDRYDLGFEEDPLSTGPTRGATMVGAVASEQPLPAPGIKKHLRKAGEHDAEPSVDVTGPSVDTAAHNTLGPGSEAAEDGASMDTAAIGTLDWGGVDHDPVPGSGIRKRTLDPAAYREPLAFEESPSRRFSRRDIMAAAAVLFVVVAGVGVGVALSSGGKHGKTGTVAIGAPSTTQFAPTTLDLGIAPPVTDTTLPPDTTPTATTVVPAVTPNPNVVPVVVPTTVPGRPKPTTKPVVTTPAPATTVTTQPATTVAPTTTVPPTTTTVETTTTTVGTTTTTGP